MPSRQPPNPFKRFSHSVVVFVAFSCFAVALVMTRTDFYGLHIASLFFLVIGTVCLLLTAFKRMSKEKLTRTILILGTLLFALPYFFLPPLGSTDIFANAYFGELVSRLHANPYTQESVPIPESAFLSLTFSETGYQTTYGPLWITLTALLTKIGESVPLTTFLIRLVLFVAFLLIIILLDRYVIVGRQNRWLLTLIAWNPFVLFEVVNNGHNDIVLALGVLGSIVAYRQNRDWAVLPFLTVAGLIKYVGFVLIPLALLSVSLRHTSSIRKRWMSIAAGLGFSLLLAYLAFSPYWAGLQTFHQIFLLASTFTLPFYHPLQLLAWLLQLVGVGPVAETAARVLGLLFFLILLVILAYRAMLKKDLSLSQTYFLSLAGLLGLVVSYFQAWYLLWILPLAFFLPQKTRAPVILGLSGLGVLTYLFY